MILFLRTLVWCQFQNSQYFRKKMKMQRNLHCRLTPPCTKKTVLWRSSIHRFSMFVSLRNKTWIVYKMRSHRRQKDQTTWLWRLTIDSQINLFQTEYSLGPNRPGIEREKVATSE